jgi:hypothetical protein
MKTQLIAGCIVAATAVTAATFRAYAGAGQTSSAAAVNMFQVGQCYRVFPANRDTFYTFKVLEAPSGPWVRVQQMPALPPVPGARPGVTQWLNSGSAFMVQEWSCQDFPQ